MPQNNAVTLNKGTLTNFWLFPPFCTSDVKTRHQWRHFSLNRHSLLAARTSAETNLPRCLLQKLHCLQVHASFDLFFSPKLAFVDVDFLPVQKFVVSVGSSTLWAPFRFQPDKQTRNKRDLHHNLILQVLITCIILLSNCRSVNNYSNRWYRPVLCIHSHNRESFHFLNTPSQIIPLPHLKPQMYLLVNVDENTWQTYRQPWSYQNIHSVALALLQISWPSQGCHQCHHTRFLAKLFYLLLLQSSTVFHKYNVIESVIQLQSKFSVSVKGGMSQCCRQAATIFLFSRQKTPREWPTVVTTPHLRTTWFSVNSYALQNSSIFLQSHISQTWQLEQNMWILMHLRNLQFLHNLQIKISLSLAVQVVCTNSLSHLIGLWFCSGFPVLMKCLFRFLTSWKSSKQYPVLWLAFLTRVNIQSEATWDQFPIKLHWFFDHPLAVSPSNQKPFQSVLLVGKGSVSWRTLSMLAEVHRHEINGVCSLAMANVAYLGKSKPHTKRTDLPMTTQAVFPS